MMSVEKKEKKKNHAKTLAVPDESQMKFGCFFIPSSGMKKQQWINGVYQTNDGNGRKLCAALVRARASFDDADTETVQRRVDEEMKNRRGRGEAQPWNRSLREENSPTKAHKSNMGARTVEDKKHLTSCHTDNATRTKS